MNRWVCEFVGTFCMVFAGTGAIMVDSMTGGQLGHVGVSLVFGLVVMVMICAVGETSGAHLNPAVTIGFWLAGRFETSRILPYLICQLAGALLASVSLRGLFGAVASLGVTTPRFGSMQAFVVEIILSMILMFVILRVSLDSRETGLFAACAVGGTIALEALLAGPICGASMNPARSLAPAVVSGVFDGVWVYLVAPFVGASLAVPLATLSLRERAKPSTKSSEEISWSKTLLKS